MVYRKNHSERRAADIIVSPRIGVIYSVIIIVCPAMALYNSISRRENIHSVSEIMMSYMVERLAVETVVMERVSVPRGNSISSRIIVIAIIIIVVAYSRSFGVCACRSRSAAYEADIRIT